MERQVILLNGPSSSGKSTLAKALQALISDKRSERYEVVSIDDFLKMSPTETIYEDDVFDISDDLCKRAVEILETCDGVIIDHVITSERIFKHLQEKLSSCHLRMVRVTCPLQLLRKRELERGDRSPGSAEASAEYLFPKEGYDLVVDTGTKSPEENSLLIIKKCFPKKKDTAHGYEEVLAKHHKSIIESYDLAETDTELFITERVNNLLFRKNRS